MSDTITRVRAAKTSGAARKAIADASYSLGVAANIEAKYSELEKALKASGSLSESDVAEALSSFSKRINESRAEASRCLDSVVNALSKVLDEVKNEANPKDKLESVRALFEILQNKLPQTEE